MCPFLPLSFRFLRRSVARASARCSRERYLWKSVTVAQCSAMADHTHGRLTSRACEMRHSCGSRITAASCTHSTRTCSAGTLLRADDDRPLPRGRARPQAAETALGPWASESRSASSMSLHPSAEAACTFPSSSSSRRGHRFSCRPSSPTITALPAASSPSHRPLPPRPAQPWSEHQQHGFPPGAPACLPQPSKPINPSSCPHPYPNPICPNTNTNSCPNLTYKPLPLP